MAQKVGDAKVTQNKKRLGLSLPEALYERLRDKAEYHGKTLNAICLEIFWNYFEDRERTNGKRQRTDNAPPASRVEREAAGRGGADGN